MFGDGMGRDNSDDAEVIYYKNHAAFHISKTGYVRFNFDHARYLENWETYRDTLREQFGYRFPKKKETPQKKGSSYSIGDISMLKEKVWEMKLEQLEELYTKNIRPILESFPAPLKLKL